tara:strand:+ start:10833 stop:11144 length:312 start_codon:yes stop_codon:yes gene_type:complete
MENELHLIRQSIEQLQNELKQIAGQVAHARGRDSAINTFGPVSIALIGALLVGVYWGAIRDNTASIRELEAGEAVSIQRIERIERLLESNGILVEKLGGTHEL